MIGISSNCAKFFLDLISDNIDEAGTHVEKGKGELQSAAVLKVSICIHVHSPVIFCDFVGMKKSKIPFSYMLYAYSVIEPIGELNLKRALDEDTGVFSSFFSLLSSSSPLGQTAVSGNSTLHQ